MNSGTCPQITKCRQVPTSRLHIKAAALPRVGKLVGTMRGQTQIQVPGTLWMSLLCTDRRFSSSHTSFRWPAPLVRIHYVDRGFTPFNPLLRSRYPATQAPQLVGGRAPKPPPAYRLRYCFFTLISVSKDT